MISSYFGTFQIFFTIYTYLSKNTGPLISISLSLPNFYSLVVCLSDFCLTTSVDIFKLLSHAEAIGDIVPGPCKCLEEVWGVAYNQVYLSYREHKRAC